jgi:hypothetical protein
VATLSRLLRAAGFEAEVALRRVGDTDDRQRAAAIEALLAFTDQMPRERRGPLDAPVFGYQRSGGRR